MTDELNISSIETHLDKVIRKHISKNCYAGRLPATLKEDVMDFVVIDCAMGIRDLNAYGSGIVNIYLYAQPINGLKNVPVLQRLETAFRKVMDESLFDNEHYKVAQEAVYSRQDYESSYDMDFIIKAINIIIH